MEQDRNLIRNNRGEKERERKIPLSQLFPITCSVNVPGQHHTSQNVSIVPHPASWSAFFLITRYSTGLFTSSLFAEPLPFVSPFWHVLSLLPLSLDLHISLSSQTKSYALLQRLSCISLSWSSSIQSTGLSSFRFLAHQQKRFYRIYLINRCNLTPLFLSAQL